MSWLYCFNKKQEKSLYYNVVCIENRPKTDNKMTKNSQMRSSYLYWFYYLPDGSTSPCLFL